MQRINFKKHINNLKTKQLKKLFLLLPLSVTAQNPNQATTELTINLTQIYSISVDENATINLTTKNDFEEGSQSQNNVMNVFATHGYRISMQTINEDFENNVNLHFNNQSAIPLSNTSTEIYESEFGTLGDVFNLYYRIDKTNMEYFLNQPDDELTTTITYTITAL